VDFLVLSQAQKEAQKAKMRAEAKAKNDPKALAGKRREKAEREQYIYEVQGDEIDEE
jgi:hypothetical protein